MLEIKHLTDDHALVAGYGIVFGAQDLAGDTFGDDTDFRLDLVPVKPVFYDHALDEPAHELGRVVKIVPDGRGLWIEAQLERSRAYARDVLRLIEQGALGWSSGSVAHLVQRAAGQIKRWPIVEFSLTPTPAEPRCLGVERIKALAASLGAGALATDGTDGTDARDGRSEWLHTLLQPKEEHTMTEQNRQQTVDVAGLAANVEALARRFDALDGTLKRFDAALEAPAVRDGFVVPAAQAAAEERACKAFDRYIRTGAKAALEEGTPEEGGYLVPRGYSDELVAALKDKSVLRAAGARVISVRGTNSFRVPTMTYSAAAVLTAEEGAFDEKEPSLGEVEFVPYKYTRLSKSSDELLDNSRIDVMNHVLIPDAVQSFAAAENIAFTTGAGPTTEPQGVVTGATVGKTATSQTAITADELMDLYHALPYMYRQNAVWMMNDTTAAQLRKLREDGASGNYLWQPGLLAGQPDTLLGRPVYTNNSMDTPAAGKKVVLFGDLSYYWIADFGGVSMKRLDELYAANGQVGFRFFRRVDARVMVAEAIQLLQMAA
jgi:HK97 family phage major capsid protein